MKKFKYKKLIKEKLMIIAIINIKNTDRFHNT